MQLTKEQRAEIVSKHSMHNLDSGSTEVQIALMTARISYLTEHFRVHKKDFAGKRGLLALVSRRRALLDYLKRKNAGKYQALIAQLNIRK